MSRRPAVLDTTGEGIPERTKLLVVSPHLDDAVLSCGELIAKNPGALVVTVMAGRPNEYPVPLPAWDLSCGFVSGDDVVLHRRSEDETALALLGARPEWLSFLPSHYAPSDRPLLTDVADAIQRVSRCSNFDIVAAPLGIVHGEHVLASNACMILAARLCGVRWLLYADAPYRTQHARHLARRLEDIDRKCRRFVEIARNQIPALKLLKRSSIECYASQLRALHGWSDALLPEQLWWLSGPEERPE